MRICLGLTENKAEEALYIKAKQTKPNKKPPNSTGNSKWATVMLGKKLLPTH